MQTLNKYLLLAGCLLLLAPNVPLSAQERRDSDRYRLHGLQNFQAKEQEMLQEWLSHAVNATRPVERVLASS